MAIDDEIEVAKHIIESPFLGRTYYPDTYKNSVFYIWWMTGKPRVSRLRTMLDPSPEGTIPTIDSLRVWIREFDNKASELDKHLEQKIEEAAVKEKVAMIERQAEQAAEMQDIAITWLKEHKDNLNPQSAVRLWVEGVKIERQSRGLPALITEISEMSDEDILTEFEKMIQNLELGGEPIDAKELPENVD